MGPKLKSATEQGDVRGVLSLWSVRTKRVLRGRAVTPHLHEKLLQVTAAPEEKRTGSSGLRSCPAWRRLVVSRGLTAGSDSDAAGRANISTFRPEGYEGVTARTWHSFKISFVY